MDGQLSSHVYPPHVQTKLQKCLGGEQSFCHAVNVDSNHDVGCCRTASSNFDW